MSHLTKPMPPRARDVYDYWFFPGCIEQLVEVLKQGKRLFWHAKDPETDRTIVERFSADLPRAATGEYNSWLETPDGMLAFIILVDQFPRHIFREDPRAFAWDPLALATTRLGMALGYDKLLEPVHRYFFYLPIMHDPRIELQRESCALYDELLHSAPEHLKQGLGIVQGAAHRHLDIIERYGRFPYRNKAFGLESTPEEIEFLKGHHTPF